jgi:sugar/nucleoside kinase (ribokinase family)
MSAGTQRCAPLVIGVVSLDIVEYDGGRRMVARFGGVTHNAARALAALGDAPVFLSPRYAGDLADAVGALLSRNGINWHPLADTAPLAHFFATLDGDGNLGNYRFLDNAAFDPLAPDILTERTRELAGRCPAVLTCTDLSQEALQALREATLEAGLPLWLIASDALTAAKALVLEPRADVVCLNSDELAQLAGPENDDRALANAARALVSPQGHAVVTLGPLGALLTGPEAEGSWRQQPSSALVRPSLGAGDVLAGALLFNRCASMGWPEALAAATLTAEAFVAAGSPLAPAFDSIHQPDSVPSARPLMP